MYLSTALAAFSGCIIGRKICANTRTGDVTGRRAQVLVATIGDTVHSALAFNDFLIMA